MDKYGFLKELRAYIASNGLSAQADEAVDYYEKYINDEIRNGKSEAEVLAGLGDPRIIGKSIVDAAWRQKSAGRGNDGNESKNPGTEAKARKKGAGQSAFGQSKLKVYGLLAIAILVILVVIIAITKVVAFFFPLILIAVIAGILLRKGGGSR